MYDEAYLAECHLVYCRSAADKAWDEYQYFLASFYERTLLFWKIMYGTHGGY